MVKVYDSEHGLQVLRKGGDSIEVSYRKDKVTFENIESIQDVALEYFKGVDPGEYVIFEADAAGIQARVGALMSQDPALVNLFMTGGDYHSFNAYNILAKHQLFDEITVKFVQQIKTYMEWEPVSITRNGKKIEHTTAKDLRKDDGVDTFGKVESVNTLARPLQGYEEFAKNVKFGRIKKYRTDGKPIGLGVIFGMGATEFARSQLRKDWTVERCQAFIKEFHLEELQAKVIEEHSFITQEDEIAYVTVATFFRNQFFKTYPRLEQWIAECAVKANVGYVVSPFGARRLLPTRTYQGRDDKKSDLKNTANIAVNSPVQEFETIIMAHVMTHADRSIERYKLKGYMIATVHDSVVGFLRKDELELGANLLLKEFMVDFPQNKGIPFFGEMNIADPAKGEVWGLGSREITYKDVCDLKLPVRSR
jgi:hypothetical protein